MPARIQQKVALVSAGKQSAIATISSAAFLQFTQLNAELTTPNFMTEDDAQEIGKGDEFAHNTFPTVWDPAGSMNKYGSAEWTSYAWAFALGGVTVTGAGPYVYTIVPIAPGTTLEPPYFTYVEQMAEGGGSALDNAYVGCAIEEVMSEIKYGAGRATHECTVSWIGSGLVTTPSGIAAPGATFEKNMSSGNLACTINGIDYVAGGSSGRILTVRQGWKNNLIKGLGWRPGSGTQALAGGLAAQVKDWIPIGVRSPSFQFEALLQHNSPEFAALVAQTSGTAVIGMTYDTNNKVTWTWEKMKYKALVNKATEGLVSVQVTGTPMSDPTNGVISITAKCGIGGICQ